MQIELGEVEFYGDQRADFAYGGKANEAASLALGGLKQAVDLRGDAFKFAQAIECENIHYAKQILSPDCLYRSIDWANDCVSSFLWRLVGRGISCRLGFLTDYILDISRQDLARFVQREIDGFAGRGCERSSLGDWPAGSQQGSCSRLVCKFCGAVCAAVHRIIYSSVGSLIFPPCLATSLMSRRSDRR